MTSNRTHSIQDSISVLQIGHDQRLSVTNQWVDQQWVDQQLVVAVEPAPISNQHGQRCGHATACARSADTDSVGVDSQLGPVLFQPRKPGLAVFHPSRVPMLATKPVFGTGADQAKPWRPAIES
jgi:hypothetical protein